MRSDERHHALSRRCPVDLRKAATPPDFPNLPLKGTRDYPIKSVRKAHPLTFQYTRNLTRIDVP
jgi:hypothetical protein